MLGTFFEVVVLLLNAVAILSEDRFLARCKPLICFVYLSIANKWAGTLQSLEVLKNPFRVDYSV